MYFAHPGIISILTTLMYCILVQLIRRGGGREGIVGKINKGARNPKRGFTARRDKSEQYDAIPTCLSNPPLSVDTKLWIINRKSPILQSQTNTLRS